MDHRRSPRPGRLQRSATSQHIVQFFDTPESLAANVSAFLAAGLKAGDVLLIVARRRTWHAVKRRLGLRGQDVGRTVAGQRIRFIDASSALAGFLRGGLPDSVLFHKRTGQLVRRMSSQSGATLRIYGEMVDLLAEEGNLYAAQRLEELWNELAVRHRFILMCGYSAAHFSSRSEREALENICRTHTHVQRSAADGLAEWLLADSRATPRSHLLS